MATDLWHAHSPGLGWALLHKGLTKVVFLAGVCVLALMALAGCGGAPANAIRGVGGEAQIVFGAGEGVGSKKYIVLENVSLSTDVELSNALIEPNENVFTPIVGVLSRVLKNGVIVEVAPCKFPPAGEQLEKRGGACVIGVEYAANAPGTSNIFAQEFGTVGAPKLRKATITVRHE